MRWVTTPRQSLGVHLFAVSNLDDVKAIRGAGIDLPILMFGARSPIVISDPLGIDWEATRVRRAGESADVGYLLEESA
jgi:predicted ABC-type sugar transport system permease subunit